MNAEFAALQLAATQELKFTPCPAVLRWAVAEIERLRAIEAAAIRCVQEITAAGHDTADFSASGAELLSALNLPKPLSIAS